jgi:hypothetical protein
VSPGAPHVLSQAIFGLGPVLTDFLPDSFRAVVSAGVKIPKVPVEKSSPPNVINRDPLRIEGVPRLAKGERRARTARAATARCKHPGDQQADRLGSKDDSEVPATTELATGVRAAEPVVEQTRSVQTVSGRTAARGSLERPSAAAGTSATELRWRLHDSEGLAATAALCGKNRSGATLRDPAGEASPSGLGPSGHIGLGSRTKTVGLHFYAGLQPKNDGGSGAGSKAGDAPANSIQQQTTRIL